jgi:hypothetical protein
MPEDRLARAHTRLPASPFFDLPSRLERIGCEEQYDVAPTSDLEIDIDGMKIAQVSHIRSLS